MCGTRHALLIFHKAANDAVRTLEETVRFAGDK